LLRECVRHGRPIEAGSNDGWLVKFAGLALDYDGTIAVDGVLDPSVRLAIGEARQQGIAVILVTGRRLADLHHVAGDLTCFDVIVGENGAVIEFPVTGRHVVMAHPPSTAFGNVARQLDGAGADAIVLFNRFYRPDIDTATMRPFPHVEFSTSAELLLRLRWLAILHGRVRPSLVVTGGVSSAGWRSTTSHGWMRCEVSPA
jgi:hypothetical protein